VTENVSRSGPAATLADQLRSLAALLEEAQAAGLSTSQILDRGLPGAVEEGLGAIARALAELEAGIRVPLTVRCGSVQVEAVSAQLAAEHFMGLAERPGRSAPIVVLDAGGRDVTDLLLRAVCAAGCVGEVDR
jgi:hypothetical protein